MTNNTYSPEEFKSMQMLSGEQYRITFDVPTNMSPQNRAAAARNIELGIINSRQFRHVRSGFSPDGSEYYEIVEVRADVSGLGAVPVVVIGGIVLIGLIISLTIAFNMKSVERIATTATVASFPIMIIALVVAAFFFAPEIKSLLAGSKEK